MKFSLIIVSILFFWSCKSHNQNNQSHINNINYEELGANITAQSQGVILAKLTSVMNENGIDGALEYCNLNVSDIMDSLSKKHKCQIRRTSLKLRNPANSPKNDDEVMILQQFHENYKQSQKLQSRLVERDGKHIYYKPIVLMMETCLKCHGKPEVQVLPSTLSKIQKLYPNDQAINYELNDFRGMWVVEFDM